MITRIWHGWTTEENANKYEGLLRTEIFENIKRLGISGFRDIQLLRRSIREEVEFITIMRFDDIEAIKAFAGQDYEACVVPENARTLLSRYDQRSQHYEIIISA